ncbi:hypothetical protein AAZX31_13G037500 [Glycine max]
MIQAQRLLRDGIQYRQNKKFKFIIAKAVQSRRTQNIGTDFLANDTSEVHEALASKPKADENTNAASVNNNYPDAGAISSAISSKTGKAPLTQKPKCRKGREIGTDQMKKLALIRLQSSSCCSATTNLSPASSLQSTSGHIRPTLESNISSKRTFLTLSYFQCHS